MKRCMYGLVVLASVLAAACSSDGAAQAASAGASNVAGNGNGSEAGASSAGASSAGANTSSAGASSAGAPNGGSSGSTETGVGGTPVTPPGLKPQAMPIISHGVPAFASSTNPARKPSDANDESNYTGWNSDTIPAWLGYDLSAVPAAQREQVLVAWYNGSTADYLNASPNEANALAVDYTIDVNDAAGGGAAPADGWKTLVTVTGNSRNSRQHLLNIEGANWVRMNVTKASNPKLVVLDLDVHSAPQGASDSWLFMGDSITFISTTYAFSNLNQLVHKEDATRWPAVIGAAIGGSNTNSALMLIDQALENFPGRYVTLNYGTNDHAAEFHMEDLVKKVIAAGKTPVVPRMPWSAMSAIQAEGPQINAQIDALYEKYPEILRGPDLWAYFLDRTEWIPANDVHPNGDGQEALRKVWAQTMTKK